MGKYNPSMGLRDAHGFLFLLFGERMLRRICNWFVQALLSLAQLPRSAQICGPVLPQLPTQLFEPAPAAVDCSCLGGFQHF